ncbi:hypothetical protein [Bradyrhizobium sp. SZCCHNRI2010]|uniref:hypothetical protein n=1 Tax=Bradyrhizobium sp. SZCCHNRI2010 TaxID=3057283 RepID=UPI0028EFE848|nr:hypothetical protein [Bradyrhizobium sp. SZCCHNRI2010]
MSKVASILRAHELARAQKVRRRHTQVEEAVTVDAMAREYDTFQRFADEWEFNDIPDRLGKTGQYEPKSIYSPAPASRIRREPPRPRRAAERNERDCELPADQRRHHTLNVTNGRGKPTATIKVNPFSKRIEVRFL